MEICRLTPEYCKAACELFNNAALAHETVMKPMTTEKFSDRFVEKAEAFHTVSLIGLINGRVIGFATGNTVPDSEKAFITYVQVIRQEQRKGYASLLLQRLEKELKEVNPVLNKYELLFFNPHNLVWCIPGEEGVEHPNTPGIDMQSSAFIFFKNMGYRDFSYQNSYYLPLKDYQFPDDIKTAERKINERGITITFYDKNKHHGFSELFDNLQNEDWRSAVMNNIAKEDAYPVVIAETDSKIVGFAGPIYVQDNGRGFFAGIGVHSEYRGGTGRVLFSALCRELKGIGARYMTLFTGEKNPARNIYEAAGFKITRSFADMRKEL